MLHLLYARFWHKVLYDLGYLSSKEPFAKLYNQGYVLAAAYLDERGTYVRAREVVAEPGGTFSHGGRPVTREWGKMGKSLKNSVSPEEIYDAYGAGPGPRPGADCGRWRRHGYSPRRRARAASVGTRATARMGLASRSFTGRGRPMKRKRSRGSAPSPRRHSIMGTSRPGRKNRVCRG